MNDIKGNKKMVCVNGKKRFLIIGIAIFAVIVSLVVSVIAMNTGSSNRNSTTISATSVTVQPTRRPNIKSVIVYVTDTGTKYHREGCSYLQSKNKLTLKEALDMGYEPCKRCNPPTK